jgi:hypothetical protein
MIDRRSPEPSNPNSPLGHPSLGHSALGHALQANSSPANSPSLSVPLPGVSESDAAGGSNVADLYDKLFSESSGWEADGRDSSLGGPVPRDAAAATAPPAPLTLRQTGLTLGTICDLILKQLYLQGNLLGIQFARQMRLPFTVVEEGLRFLKDDKCIEVTSGDLVGPVSYRFNLTDLGRKRAREAFEMCRYVGPAPVPLDAYAPQCRRQTVTGTECSAEALKRAFGNLVIREEVLQDLGPAVCSGKSIFVYGPPGNGKTMIAKALGNFLNLYGGDIYVPYAIYAENSIITVFDPTIHRATDNADVLDQIASENETGSITDPFFSRQSPPFDLRWRRVRRPVVITAGELTLEMLDLRYNSASNFYTAPLHIKANCGVFLIDDFGRQIVSPRDLLNRWIMPLEERVDFLTLATGRKFSVPFEQLIIFSTNLDPRELVDEAFLRRIQHKIMVGPPDRELFADIFRLCCQQRSIEFNPACLDFLYEEFYDRGKTPRSSDPRDLLEIVRSICRYRRQDVVISKELMAEAARRFFVQM